MTFKDRQGHDLCGAETLITGDTIRPLTGDLGFTLVGVAAAEPSRHGDFVRRWLGEGHHGQMGYLADHLDKRLDPRKLLPGAKSIICVADRHPSKPPPPPELPPPPEVSPEVPSQPPLADQKPSPTGRVARYAWGDDYHKVIKKRLFQLADALRERYPGHEYKTTVDTAPILEREYAQLAGLGWTGKHTLLIHPQLGSWMLLGTIVTTLEIEPDEPATDHCGTCTRCIDACPTSCIKPYELDAQRCISYLTIEYRDEIPVDMHTAMGDWIAGCDVCQEVCPYNQDDRLDAAKDSQPVHDRYTTPRVGAEVALLDVLDWDADARRQALTGSALKRINLDMFKRNALIAAGNDLAHNDHPALRQRIEELAQDPNQPPLVRKTAQQVLART